MTGSIERIKVLFLCAVLSFMLLLISGCSTVKPVIENGLETRSTWEYRFDYSPYVRLLERVVNDKGRVDYETIINQPADLEEFYSLAALRSPLSHPEVFPTESDKLAYWINGYNAAVMKGVIRSYPINSVEEVKAPFPLSFLPSKSGFFLLQRFVFGGEEISLYALENNIIRKQFNDPRFHFALNCASLSCPELPQIPFFPQTLDEQLEFETKKFINDKRNVRLDKDRGVLFLSSIFRWYEEDFTTWLKQYHPEQEASLVNYVLLYLDSPDSDEVRAADGGVEISYLQYDWGLNGQ